MCICIYVYKINKDQDSNRNRLMDFLKLTLPQLISIVADVLVSQFIKQ